MTFHKYSKIKAIDSEDVKNIFSDKSDVIVIEEKMDGANFRFMIKDKKVIFGSRTQELDSENIQNNWKRCVNYILEKTHQNINNECYDNYIFYGECMIKHSMNYDWDKIPPFLGFDVRDKKTLQFLDLDQAMALFEDLDLDFVPIIDIKEAKDIKDLSEDLVPESKYADLKSQDKKAEGIVFKNYEKQLFAKLVREKFKEVNREHFGGGKKYAETDDERICAMFCTNARIDKIIFKLLDSGEILELKLMEKLPRAVIEDIYEEHWKDICFSRWSVNFNNIRKLITKRCLAVLQQVITNNSLKPYNIGVEKNGNTSNN